MVRHGRHRTHGIIPATSARRLPGLHLAAAADRTDALPGTFRARPVARRDGDRLLRFPRLAGSDLRRRPRRTVRGAQRRQSGAGLSSPTAAPMASRRRWNMRSRCCASSTSWCSAMPNAAASAPSSTRSTRCRRAISSAAGWRCSSSRARVVGQRERETMQDFTTRIEKAAVFRSLENLMTFPFVRTPRRARRDGICTAPISASPRARCSCSTRRRRNFAACGRIAAANSEARSESVHVAFAIRYSAIAPGCYAAFFFALISLRLIRHSAIWIAFSAAPLRRLSDTHHSDRPFSTVLSSRMRLI